MPASWRAEAAGLGETVAVLSGDGMVGAVADALRDDPGAVLGVLPGGRGNDLARVLGIPEDPKHACRAIDEGIRSTGSFQAGGCRRGDSSEGERAFVGIASAGFDSDANRIANEAPSWLGGLVYAYGALRALVSWRPARFEIELDPPGERHTFTGYTVAAANSRAYGGGMYLAPEAMLDDGLIDIVVTESVGKLRFLANLPKVFKGTHVQLPSVRVFRAAEVRISADRPFTMYADGDPIGDLPVRVRALQGAINMLVPLQSQARPAASMRSPSSLRPREGRLRRPPGRVPGERLMSRALAAKLALARGVGALSRLRGGGATSAPGKVLMRLEPSRDRRPRRAPGAGQRADLRDQRQDHDGRDGREHPLRAGRHPLVHNQAGANMAGGIATDAARRRPFAWRDLGRARTLRGGRAVARHSRRSVAPAGDPALEPVPRPARPLRRARDDRRQLGTGAARRRPDARLVLNADDPLIADLGRERAEVVYFGVEDDSLALSGMAHAADSKHCRHCGAPYVFVVVYLGHLGHYHCPSCGQKRPASSDHSATDVMLEGVRSARFTLRTPEGERRGPPRLPGLYNVYNALAAAALAEDAGGSPAEHRRRPAGDAGRLRARGERHRRRRRRVRQLSRWPPDVASCRSCS